MGKNLPGYGVGDRWSQHIGAANRGQRHKRDAVDKPWALLGQPQDRPGSVIDFSMMVEVCESDIVFLVFYKGMRNVSQNGIIGY